MNPALSVPPASTDVPDRDVATGELHVLLVEDSRSDAELAILRLQQAGYACSSQCVVSETEMRTALAGRLPDIILSDFSLPQFDGMSALAIARTLVPDVPFIFLSGTIGEERAIEALKCGAIDYVLKSNPKRLVPAIKRALQDATLRRTSRLTEQRVARLSRVLQMLSGVNAALVRIQDRAEAIKETCRLAHSVGNYAIVMVALINPATRLARRVGRAGYDFLADPEQEFPVADHEGGDTSLLGRVIRTGDSVLCEDIERSPYVIEGRHELIAAGVCSLACLPLRIDNTPVGSFLCGTRGAVIDQDEMLMLEEVAANLSFALQYLDKQEALHFLSYFEPLTGLAKRTLFCERLNRLLTRGGGTSRLAVTVLDIDRLAVINDSHGRHTGDRLLQCVADRLKGYFPDSEQLAHLGGGTFVYMSATSEPDADGELDSLPANVNRIFDRPFSVDGREITARIKSGVAYYPGDGRDPQELVQNAESALKEAKASGERYLHHRIEMNSELARRVAMEHRLLEALDKQQFRLHYQPKIDLRSGRIVGAEALLRWHDPEQGLTPPGVFLPLLESTGLMAAVDAWVLKQAAADCRKWRQKGFKPIRVAVNLSPPALRKRDSAREILECIGAQADDAAWGIDIEITEGALAGDSSACIQTLRLLRAAGMRIAIDDFGTGFSSLGRLSELPIDTLKIDRTFIQRLPEDRKSCTLVSTVIGLARAFDMTTVAEGVEEPPQLDYLIREGCDESQGYLHSRPVPDGELEIWLMQPAEALARVKSG